MTQQRQASCVEKRPKTEYSRIPPQRLCSAPLKFSAATSLRLPARRRSSVPPTPIAPQRPPPASRGPPWGQSRQRSAHSSGPACSSTSLHQCCACACAVSFAPAAARHPERARRWSSTASSLPTGPAHRPHITDRLQCAAYCQRCRARLLLVLSLKCAHELRVCFGSACSIGMR